MTREDTDGEAQYPGELAERDEHTAARAVDVHCFGELIAVCRHLHEQEIVGTKRLRRGGFSEAGDDLLGSDMVRATEARQSDTEGGHSDPPIHWAGTAAVARVVPGRVSSSL